MHLSRPGEQTKPSHREASPQRQQCNTLAMQKCERNGVRHLAENRINAFRQFDGKTASSPPPSKIISLESTIHALGAKRARSTRDIFEKMSFKPGNGVADGLPSSSCHSANSRNTKAQPKDIVDHTPVSELRKSFAKNDTSKIASPNLTHGQDMATRRSSMGAIGGIKRGGNGKIGDRIQQIQSSLNQNSSSSLSSVRQIFPPKEEQHHLRLSPVTSDGVKEAITTVLIEKKEAVASESKPELSPAVTETLCKEKTEAGILEESKPKETTPKVLRPKRDVEKNVCALKLNIDLETYTAPVFEKNDTQDELVKKATATNFVVSDLAQGDHADVETFVKAFEPLQADHGTVLVEQGASGNHLYIVESGKVEFQVDGITVGSATAGGTFGEMNMLFSAAEKATIVASSEDNAPTKLLRVDQATFRGIMQTREKSKADNVVGSPAPATPLKEDTEPWDSSSSSSNDDSRAWLVDSTILKERALIRKSLHDNVKVDNLERISILGEGQFGEVWLVATELPGIAPLDCKKQQFALKIQYKVDELRDDGAEEAIRNEIRAMEQLNHPFIANLLQTYESKASIDMLMGLVTGGELWDLIHREDEEDVSSRGIPMEHAQFYGIILADTLAYIHGQQYVFRDLKPENIMIDSDGYPIIVDFGFAKYCPSKTYTFCGTPNYVAPEIIKNSGHNAGADWWAFGVVIYEMITGENPFFFDGMELMALYQAVVEDGYEPLLETYCTSLRDLIDKLLVKDPILRLGMLAGKAKDVVNHAWFDGLDLPKLRSKEVEAPWIPSKGGRRPAESEPENVRVEENHENHEDNVISPEIHIQQEDPNAENEASFDFGMLEEPATDLQRMERNAGCDIEEADAPDKDHFLELSDLRETDDDVTSNNENGNMTEPERNKQDDASMPVAFLQKDEPKDTSMTDNFLQNKSEDSSANSQTIQCNIEDDNDEVEQSTPLLGVAPCEPWWHNPEPKHKKEAKVSRASESLECPKRDGNKEAEETVEKPSKPSVGPLMPTDTVAEPWWHKVKKEDVLNKKVPPAPKLHTASPPQPSSIDNLKHSKHGGSPKKSKKKPSSKTKPTKPSSSAQQEAMDIKTETPALWWHKQELVSPKTTKNKKASAPSVLSPPVISTKSSKATASHHHHHHEIVAQDDKKLVRAKRSKKKHMLFEDLLAEQTSILDTKEEGGQVKKHKSGISTRSEKKVTQRDMIKGEKIVEKGAVLDENKGNEATNNKNRNKKDNITKGTTLTSSKNGSAESKENGNNIEEELKKKKKKTVVKTKKTKRARDTFNLEDINALRERAKQAFIETQVEISEEHQRQAELRKEQTISIEQWAKHIQNQANNTITNDGEDILQWMDEFQSIYIRLREIETLLNTKCNDKNDDEDDDKKNEDYYDKATLQKEKTILLEKEKSRQKDYIQFCIDQKQKEYKQFCMDQEKKEKERKQA